MEGGAAEVNIPLPGGDILELSPLASDPAAQALPPFGPPQSSPSREEPVLVAEEDATREPSAQRPEVFQAKSGALAQEAEAEEEAGAAARGADATADAAVPVATAAGPNGESDAEPLWSATNFPARTDEARANVEREASRRRGLLIVGAATVVVIVVAALWLRQSTQVGARNGEGEPTLAGGRWNGGDKAVSARPAPGTMIFIAGGEFIMGRDGSADPFERPSHRVRVAPFKIDAYEVTREEYARFIQKEHRQAPLGWRNGIYPEGTGLYPVTGVTWDEANAYAKSVGKRLPTEQEWEFAARGADGRLYPWGNEWQDGQANIGHETGGGLAAVGTSGGATPEGVYDLIGNAWEWTSSKLQPYPGGSLLRLPPGDLKVVRGGSWREDTSTTATYRGYLQARGGKDYSGTGFRCAQDLQPSDPR
jgi:formylglycine-generating enzyme required for sulfatase activity